MRRWGDARDSIGERVSGEETIADRRGRALAGLCRTGAGMLMVIAAGALVSIGLAATRSASSSTSPKIDAG